MRVLLSTLLSTLAVMSISVNALTSAHANEMDRDPEHSIEQSNTVANEPYMPNDYDSVSRMEPAAGIERADRNSDRMMRHEPITKADTVRTHKPVVSKKTTTTEYKKQEQYGDVEGSVTPSRNE